ncbi:hypothetical protein [Curtanaerobium respiraculi]|uniref:hypothetical protein n=1 Tax=Curtanaerobium respiraculi TaxID=2949669 RepID=UPI0024B38518|nr:hypothetical protein [Curtanaerobium respiraculi]
MADDFGDDSGEKLFDTVFRISERAGERAMIYRSRGMSRAFAHASEARTEPADAGVEWARLDMHEFEELEDRDAAKAAVESKLKSKGVESAWFEDQAAKRECLLFRVEDAQEVADALGELSHETDAARERASEKIRGRAEEQRDARTLDERAKDAREASEALEKGATRARQRARDPRFEEARSR